MTLSGYLAKPFFWEVASERGAELSRWRELLVCAHAALGRRHLSLLSAGLAMYAMLAVFPGLAAVVFVYGAFATPDSVIEHMNMLAALLPRGTWALFSAPLTDIASARGGSLPAGALIGLLLGLWSARSGMAALITATNWAYSSGHERGVLKEGALSLLFTVVAVAGFLLALAIGVLVPALLRMLGTQAWLQVLIASVQWTLLWVMAASSLAVVYRFAPARAPDSWRAVIWGAGSAATLWLTISVLFSFYVRTIADYSRTYGALAAVVALLMWFYLSSFTIVFGAQLNAELERLERRRHEERTPPRSG